VKLFGINLSNSIATVPFTQTFCQLQRLAVPSIQHYFNF